VNLEHTLHRYALGREPDIKTYKAPCRAGSRRLDKLAARVGTKGASAREAAVTTSRRRVGIFTLLPKQIFMLCRVMTLILLSMFLCYGAAAQEGHYGVGHEKWHGGFYTKLKRNDGQGSCCTPIDCRPTQSRMVGDHYEVKIDGEWTLVPNNKINNVVAPDGGAHVCAPRQVGPNKGVVFCVVLPPEG
jgi:hypothetical protein